MLDEWYDAYNDRDSKRLAPLKKFDAPALSVAQDYVPLLCEFFEAGGEPVVYHMRTMTDFKEMQLGRANSIDLIE